MDQDQLIKLVLSFESAICEVVSLGVRYEVWLQVELARKLKGLGYSVELERRYPEGGGYVDLHAAKDGTEYWIEIKTESAARAGRFAGRYFGSSDNDIDKLQRLLTESFKGDPENLWVLCIGHSKAVRRSMAAVYGDVPASHLGCGERICAAVYSAYHY